MQRTTTTPLGRRVRINAGVLGAEGQTGTDEGPGFSLDAKLAPRYHHIKLDGRDRTSAFRPSEFTRVSS